MYVYVFLCVHLFAGWSAAQRATMLRLTSVERRLFTGGGQEIWQHYNSETPCEPAIDQIVTPCSARLSHRQAQDIIGLTHTNRDTHTHTRTELLFHDDIGRWQS